MKKRLLLISFALAVASVSAQNKTVPGKTDVEQQEYLKVEEVPNSLYILPVHPEFNSVQFLNDQYQYYWGKNIRKTERGKQAVSDATLDGLHGMNNAFGEVFGTPITLENTPEIFLLVRSIGRDAGGIAPKKAKNHYMRTRPFVFFNDTTSTPENEDHMRESGSYPSGHSCYGFAAALILAEINPEHQNEIIRRGYEIGESRKIVGAHYDSDVQAGRIMAAATVAALHSNAAFQKQLAKAKEEFAKLKKAGKIKASTAELK
ncbi:MAG: phosphatase PAP2 family protein [Bacteroidales bacterium]|nr:phosphatase PAP2 family protein [Bacteroidales bacterium]